MKTEKAWWKKKVYWQAAAVLVGTMTLALTLAAADSRNCLPQDAQGRSQIERNTQGGGEKEVSLDAEVETGDGKKKLEEIAIAVGERQYEEAEIEEVLGEAGVELETQILGQNKTLDEVRSDLELPARVPNTSIEVSWELSNYEVMDMQGKLQSEKLTEGGTTVELSALLTYEGQHAMHKFSACVYPPVQTAEERLREKVLEAVSADEEKTKTEAAAPLPNKVDGMAVTWSRPKEQRGLAVLLIGIVLAGLVLALDKQNRVKAVQERKKQMMVDYPEIINKFTVLLGAGMTVKNAWTKVAADYENRSDKKKTRYAYEEMIYTFHEMQGGVTEAESYERFGRRCGITAYVKFGALLSQNLRKGSKGLAQLLTMEAVNAFEERKGLARRLGEEASTKLLLPMFLMLAIVLVIVIVPAFFSMQM